MAKSNVYQYAVWFRDPKGDAEKDELISEVTSVTAQNDEHVKRIALRSLDAKWDDKLANIEVLVRPF